jgi:hypothetical protein
MAPDVELHRLVVKAEQQARSGRRAAGRIVFRTVLAVLITGAAVAGGWMTRDRWSSQVQEVVQQLAERTLSAGRALAAGTRSVVSMPGAAPPAETRVNIQRETAAAVNTAAGQAQQPAPQLSPQSVPPPLSQPSPVAAAQTALPQVSSPPVAEALPDSDALQREAERLVRIKAEAEKLASERRAAERRLAQEKAARVAAERKARIERERLLAAKVAARQAADARVRAERQAQEQAAGQPAAAPKTVADRPTPLTKATPTVADSLASDPVVFTNNPCNGPTARFMSTCR